MVDRRSSGGDLDRVRIWEVVSTTSGRCPSRRKRTSCSARALVQNARALPCFARERKGKDPRKAVGREARAMGRLAMRTRCEKAPESDGKKHVEAQKLRRAARKAAGTFAPRPSTPAARPAARGTVLCTVFEVQAVASMAVGGMLACNVLFPSDGATVARMLGMWSVWMLAVPSLRARECSQDEKEALDYAFLAMPLANVAIPMLWKSFAGVYVADVLMLVALYAWKGAMPGRMAERAGAEEQ